MRMRFSWLIVLVAGIFSCPFETGYWNFGERVIAQQLMDSDEPQVDDEIPTPIRTLLNGFNKEDPEIMGTALSEGCEVRYISENGESALGSKDRASLVAQMKGYFKNIKEPQSKLSQVTLCGRFVTGRETVSWSTSDGRRTQYSLVVFELSADQDEIARVWYYPAQNSKNE